MNKTEQLSTSTQNPKIELPNKTLVGVKPTEKKSEELGKVPQNLRVGEFLFYLLNKKIKLKAE